MQSDAAPRLSRVLAAVLIASGAPALAAPAPQAASPGREPLVDSHLHIANYAMAGRAVEGLRRPVHGRPDRAVGGDSPAPPAALDRTERYADGQLPPNYYLGPKADLYYYSFIEALLATEYLKLSPADRARASTR